MNDERFENPKVYSSEVEDRSARKVYFIESLAQLSTEELPRAITNPAHVTRREPTTRYGLPYEAVYVFVPIGWDTLDDPKSD